MHPAAEHHYLVCPRIHIPNAKCLTKNDLELGMQYYLSLCQEVMQKIKINFKI